MSHRLLAAALVALLALTAACSGATSGAAPAVAAGVVPADFPDDFPLPEDAEVTSRGDSLTLSIDRPAEEVRDELGAGLEAAGWEATAWEGVDPNGAPTTGWTIERDEEAGVVAITDASDGVVVRVNFAQPFHDPQRGMGLYSQP